MYKAVVPAQSPVEPWLTFMLAHIYDSNYCSAFPLIPISVVKHCNHWEKHRYELTVRRKSFLTSTCPISVLSRNLLTTTLSRTIEMKGFWILVHN